MGLEQVETLLWYGNVVAAVCLLVAMWRQGLIRSYPALFSYLAVDVIQQVTGIAVVRLLGSSAGPYFYVYSIGQTVKLVLAILIALELAQHSLRSYPALAAFARKATLGSIAVALLLSGVALWLTPPILVRSQSWELSYFLAFERSIDLAVLVLLLALAVFIGWFPMRLSKNSAYYLGGYFSFFAVRWIGTSGQNFAPQFRIMLSAAMLACSFLCLVALALRLTKRGEEETVMPGHSWNPDAMERLQTQLEVLNTHLARVRSQG